MNDNDIQNEQQPPLSTTDIYLQKRRIGLTIFHTLLLFCFGLIILILSVFKQQWLWILIGAFITLFFGCGILCWFKQLIRSTPIIQLTTLGIIDESSIMKIGLIEWQDIQSIQTKTYQGVEFICIEVIDENKYLQRLNWFQKTLSRWHQKIGFPMICLYVNNTNLTVDKAFSLMQQYHAQHAN